MFAILGDNVRRDRCGSFETFQVLLAIADNGGVRHLFGQFLKMRLDLLEFLPVLPDAHAITSSPPCFVSSAIAPFSASMATLTSSSDGGFVVIRCVQSPGAVSRERNEPRRFAANRISS